MVPGQRPGPLQCTNFTLPTRTKKTRESSDHDVGASCIFVQVPEAPGAPCPHIALATRAQGRPGKCIPPDRIRGVRATSRSGRSSIPRAKPISVLLVGIAYEFGGVCGHCRVQAVVIRLQRPR